MSKYIKSVGGPLYGADGNEIANALIAILPVLYVVVDELVQVNLFDSLIVVNHDGIVKCPSSLTE